MKYYLMKQCHNAATIEQIVYLVNHFLCDISVVFVAAWTGNA